MLLLTLALLGGPDSRLAVIRDAPDFALTTHDDKPLIFSKLNSKVRLVSFIFTTCNGSCPATTHRMARVAELLKDKGLFDGDRVRLVSVTLDPARDTPDVLKRYRRLYEADPAHWNFLTGTPDEVGKVLDAWGMWTKPSANGQLDHPSRVFLLDKRGRVREIYSLEFFKPAWAVEDVQSLLKEPGSDKAEK